LCKGTGKKRVLSRFYPIETILIFFQQENDTGGGRFFRKMLKRAAGALWIDTEDLLIIDKAKSAMAYA
jgi:hypothetical protein